MKEVLDKVSARHPMVKFVQMISTDCIKDYPDKYALPFVSFDFIP